MQISFPFPSWATRHDEVAEATEGDVFDKLEGD
jgi:hypothetical protein